MASGLLGPKTAKEEGREKEKTKLGVCRIRKLHKSGKGYETVGSGSVIKNLLNQWPWKEKCCVVTSDKVLPEKDFDINKFELEFMKINSTIRTFNLGRFAKSDDVQWLTSGLVVIPLQDPTKIGQSPSIFTHRPFRALPNWKGEELPNELFCPIVDDTHATSFDVKPYTLKLDDFVLHDGQSSFKTLAEFTGSSNRKPHGAVILSISHKSLNAVGVLNCSEDGRIAPVWLSHENLSSSRPSSVKKPEQQSPIGQQSAAEIHDPDHSSPLTHVPGTREKGTLTSSPKSARKGRKPRSNSQPGLEDPGSQVLIKITPTNLDDQQKDKYKKWLKELVAEYLDSHDDVTSEKGQDDLQNYIRKTHGVLIETLKLGSLEIIVQCPTLSSLESLWSDYCSGHLNDVAERFLVTDDIKRELEVETITLKTTITKEDYLACKKSLLETSGEAGSTSRQAEPEGSSAMWIRLFPKMPIEKVLRAFAEKIFDDHHYYPVSHGQTSMVKPLALVVKKRRSSLKRPFAKSEFIVTGVLENYVEKEKKQEFTETVNSIISKEKNPLKLADEEDEKEAIGASSHAFVIAFFDIWELELGKLDQEYIKDPDLRELLANTALDADRMEGLEDQKLRLIYSVIYSERFLLEGRRKHEIEVDAGVKAAFPEVAEFLSKYFQLRGQYKKKVIPPKAATRNTRGPVFFKFVRVDYDKENGRLKLSEGELAGRAVKADERGDEKDKAAEYNKTVVGMELEDIDFSEPLTEEDYKKLEKIMESGLMSSESSRQKRKERVKKYLSWFEEALMKEQQKISVDKPLTDEDCEFLRTICCPALPSQSIVDLSPFDAEKIQGYAIVLKQIDELSDEHWDEIEKAWAKPGQNK